jgi:hypothetical protein
MRRRYWFLGSILGLLCVSILAYSLLQDTENTSSRSGAIHAAGYSAPPVPLVAPIAPHTDTSDPRVISTLPGRDSSTPQSQADEYNAERPKSIVELQQFRRTASMRIRDQDARQGVATLINLNPRINAWFLLRLDWADGQNGDTYHLENARPERQRIVLDAGHPDGIVIEAGDGRHPCDLWSGSSAPDLSRARTARSPYSALCEGRVYLRSPTQGRMTSKEWAAEFLRRNVWGGESIVNFVKANFFEDAFLNTSDVIAADAQKTDGGPHPADAPEHPLLNPALETSFLAPTELGIELEKASQDEFLVGHWYRARGLPGVFVATIEPRLVSEDVIKSQQGLVSQLDQVESAALAHLVAFNLAQFDAGFAMGTVNPGVGWSERVLPGVRNDQLPGPDGIGNVAPVINTGMLAPYKSERVIATFAGGFKRHHGAFSYTEFALRNHGSHYGFVENGVVMSKLLPGLATFVAYDDGRVDLKTWTQKDDAGLQSVRHARQDGLPVIDYDEETRVSAPGAYVKSRLGNWSGAQDMSFRTVRAGLCLDESEHGRFLIYGFFSAATPSAMARVFGAYHCKYAMHLDMNALEHTYLALYPRRGAQAGVEYLIKGMSVLDKSDQGVVVPRFVGYADNRDFFYVLKKE